MLEVVATGEETWQADGTRVDSALFYSFPALFPQSYAMDDAHIGVQNDQPNKSSQTTNPCVGALGARAQSPRPPARNS